MLSPSREVPVPGVDFWSVYHDLSEIRRRMCDLGIERRACNSCTRPGQVGQGLEYPGVVEVSLPVAQVE